MPPKDFRKPDEECSPITLIMRKYYSKAYNARSSMYHAANKDRINSKNRERYNNDPEYRQRIRDRQRVYSEKKRIDFAD